MPLFEVGNRSLREIEPLLAGPDLYEREIEELLWADLQGFLGEMLFPLARQARIDGGGIPDILALDDSGRVVVIEVKRDVDRQQLAQCLEYAGWARTTSLDEVSSLYHGGRDQFFDDWQDFTNSSVPVVVNPHPRLVLVAGEVHGRTRSAIDFLVENGLPVQLVTVSLYADSHGSRYMDVRAERAPQTARPPHDGLPPSVSGVGQLYYSFWAHYLERLHQEHPTWSSRHAPLTQNWMNQPSPAKGTVISLSFASGGRLRHELYIDAGDEVDNLRLLRLIESQRGLFEAAYGRSVVFEELSGKRACRVGDYRPGVAIADSDRYEEYIDWFFDAGERLRSAIAAVDLGSS